MPSEILTTDTSLQGWGPPFGTNSSTVRGKPGFPSTRSGYGPCFWPLTVRPLRWIRRHGILLKSSFIPGKDKLLANVLSHGRFRTTEWQLHPTPVMSLLQLHGQPVVDQSASSVNHQLPAYCARYREPQALTTDALSISWTFFFGYAFPPVTIFSWVLQLIEDDQASVLLLARSSRVVPGRGQRIFSQRATSRFAGSRRTPTRLTYRTRLVHFFTWCSAQETDPSSVGSNLLCDFFIHVFDQGLSPSTLRGYRSAIAFDAHRIRWWSFSFGSPDYLSPFSVLLSSTSSGSSPSSFLESTQGSSNSVTTSVRTFGSGVSPQRHH